MYCLNFNYDILFLALPQMSLNLRLNNPFCGNLPSKHVRSAVPNRRRHVVAGATWVRLPTSLTTPIFFTKKWQQAFYLYLNLMRSKEKSGTLDLNKDCTLLHSFMCSRALCISTNAAFHPLKMKYTVSFTNSTGVIVCKLCNKILNRTLICD